MSAGEFSSKGNEEWQLRKGYECENCGASPVKVFTSCVPDYVQDGDPVQCPSCNLLGSMSCDSESEPWVNWSAEPQEKLSKEPWVVSGWHVDGCLGVKLPSGLTIKITPMTTPDNVKADRARVEKEIIPILKAKMEEAN